MSQQTTPDSATEGMMVRYGRIEEMDRSFDREFWQAQSASDRFAAVWGLAVLAYAIKGRANSLVRLHRDFDGVGRIKDTLSLKPAELISYALS